MRNLSLVFLAFFAAIPLTAQLHEATPVEVLMERAHHAMMMQSQPAAFTPVAVPEASSKVFNINAHQFAFGVTPSPFVVDQGDTVTLHVKSSDVTHGFLLEQYAPDGVILQPGDDNVIQFVANTAGRFTYFCIVPTCGSGHINMSGTFTVNAVVDTAPTITSVSPTTGSTAGGTTLTIVGTNFATGATVKLGGRDALNVNVVDSTTITVKTPLGPASELAGQPLDVTVTNADSQSATKTQAFSYFVPAPSITTIAPSAGSSTGGTTVTITGVGFTTAVVTTVTFGGAAATQVTVLDAVTLTAVAPAHAAGTVDVIVKVGNSSATKASAFTFATPGKRRRAARP